MFGWAGRILHVDLTREKVFEEDTSKYSGEFIGGRGVNIRLLYELVGPGVEALSSENVLILGTGPLTGTSAPSSSRTEVTSKSPLTGLLGQSNFGGFFGAELKFAGYDCLVIHGRSSKPTYLYIEDGRVEFRDASNIWGRDTFETMNAVREEVGDPEAKVVCIGPAGENLVKYASLIHDMGDGAGRTGMGCVMGSKSLKAVAVRGTGKIPVAEPERFLEICEEMHSKLRSVPDFEEVYVKGFDEMSHYGDMGWALVGNQERVSWGLKTEAYRVIPFIKKYRIRTRACFGCPLGCMQFIDLPGVGACLQSCQGFVEPCFAMKIPSQEDGFRIARFCEAMGIDIIEASHIVAFMMELYERGIVTDRDTDGIRLRWGDPEAAMTLLEKIVRREGVGKLLAEGIPKAAEAIGRGSEKYAMHTKGLSHYVYDLRAFKGCALATAVGPRDLVRSLPVEYLFRYAEAFSPEDVEEYLKFAKEVAGTERAAVPNSYEGKAAMVVYQEHEHAVADMMGVCKWTTTWLGMPLTSKELTQMFNLCTGVQMDVSDVLRAAERVINLERCFNVREGVMRRDDTLPDRYFKEPLPDGPYRGEALDRDAFERMKDEYYAMRGWNTETGVPTKEKLLELGLTYAAEELERLGKLPEKM